MGEAWGRARTRTQVLIDSLSQALPTLPRGKQGASPYLYQLTGAAVMGKEGGRGPLPAAVVPWAAAGSTSVAWFFTDFPSQKSRASCLSSDLILTSLSVYYFLF